MQSPDQLTERRGDKKVATGCLVCSLVALIAAVAFYIRVSGGIDQPPTSAEKSGKEQNPARTKNVEFEESAVPETSPSSTKKPAISKAKDPQPQSPGEAFISTTRKNYHEEYDKRVRRPVEVKKETLKAQFQNALDRKIAETEDELKKAKAQGNLDLSSKASEALSQLIKERERSDSTHYFPSPSSNPVLDSLLSVYDKERDQIRAAAYSLHRVLLREYRQKLKTFELSLVRTGSLEEAQRFRSSRESFVLSNLPSYGGSEHVYRVETSGGIEKFRSTRAVIEGWHIRVTEGVSGRSSGSLSAEIKRTDGTIYPRTGYYKTSSDGLSFHLRKDGRRIVYEVKLGTTLKKNSEAEIRIGDASFAIPQNTYGKRDQISKVSMKLIHACLGTATVTYDYVDATGRKQEGVEEFGPDFEQALCFALTRLGFLEHY